MHPENNTKNSVFEVWTKHRKCLTLFCCVSFVSSTLSLALENVVVYLVFIHRSFPFDRKRVNSLFNFVRVWRFLVCYLLDIWLKEWQTQSTRTKAKRSNLVIGLIIVFASSAAQFDSVVERKGVCLRIVWFLLRFCEYLWMAAVDSSVAVYFRFHA